MEIKKAEKILELMKELHILKFEITELEIAYNSLLYNKEYSNSSLIFKNKFVYIEIKEEHFLSILKNIIEKNKIRIDEIKLYIEDL